MLIKRIDGATRYLGAPVGWNPDDGVECAHLAVRDYPHGDDGNVMVSAWEPTPTELDALRRGAPIYLHVWGTAHPPVAIEVGKP